MEFLFSAFFHLLLYVGFYSDLPSLPIRTERTQLSPIMAVISSMHLLCGLLWLRYGVRCLRIDVLWVRLSSPCLATCPTPPLSQESSPQLVRRRAPKYLTQKLQQMVLINKINFYINFFFFTSPYFSLALCTKRDN